MMKLLRSTRLRSRRRVPSWWPHRCDASSAIGCSSQENVHRSPDAFHDAAVNRNAGAGDVGGLARGEEGHQRGQFFWFAEPPQRDVLFDALDGFFDADAKLLGGALAQGTLAIRQDAAGDDVVDGDVIWPQLLRERFCQADHARADAVGEGQPLNWLAHRGRDEVDDASAALLAQMRKRGVDEPDDAHQVEVKRLLPLLFGGGGKGAGRGTARVADKDVESAKLAGGSVNDLADVVRFGDIGLDGDGLRALRARGGGGFVERVEVAGKDGDVDALRCQGDGAGAAQSFTSGGDDGALSLDAEIHRDAPPINVISI